MTRRGFLKTLVGNNKVRPRFADYLVENGDGVIKLVFERTKQYIREYYDLDPNTNVDDLFGHVDGYADWVAEQRDHLLSDPKDYDSIELYNMLVSLRVLIDFAEVHHSKTTQSASQTII